MPRTEPSGTACQPKAYLRQTSDEPQRWPLTNGWQLEPREVGCDLSVAPRPVLGDGRRECRREDDVQ